MLKNLPFYSSTYALIKDNVVQNIIVADSYPTAVSICAAQKCDEPVCVDQYLVAIGDQYIDGVFYHEGKEVERQLTLEEENKQLKQAIAELTILIAGGM